MDLIGELAVPGNSQSGVLGRFQPSQPISDFRLRCRVVRPQCRVFGAEAIEKRVGGELIQALRDGLVARGVYRRTRSLVRGPGDLRLLRSQRRPADASSKKAA